MNIIRNDFLNLKLGKALSSICTIIIDSEKIGYGFLIKLYRGDKPFFCLMTNESIINKIKGKSKENIEIIYDKGNKKFAIKSRV